MSRLISRRLIPLPWKGKRTVHPSRSHAEDLLPAGHRVARNISLNYLYSGLMSVKLDWTVWMLFLSYRGIGFVEIGLIESASRLSSLAFGVPAGLVSDILGRKVSAVLSVLTRVAGLVLMVISHDFMLFVLAFGFNALSQVLFNATYESITYDSCNIIGREYDYKKKFSNLLAVMFVSSAAGATACGFIASVSYKYLYFASIAISFAAIIPALLFDETIFILKRSRSRINLKDHMTNVYRLVKSKRTVAYMIGLSVTILIVDNSIFMYLQKHFTDKGIPLALLGILFAVDQVLVAVGSKLSHLLDRFRVKDVIMAVPLMMILSYMLLATIDHAASCVFLFVVAVLLAMFYPIQSEIVNRLIPVESRATLMSFRGQLRSLGVIIVFPVMGVIADKTSLSVAFLALLGSALPVLLYLTIRLRGVDLQGNPSKPA